MSNFPQQSGEISGHAARLKTLESRQGVTDLGGRVFGSPDTAIGVFPSDASAVTYTPADNTDWAGSADPGNVDDALDQLAGSVTTLQAGIAATFTQKVVVGVEAMHLVAGTGTIRGTTPGQTPVVNCGVSTTNGVAFVWEVPGDWDSGTVSVILRYATQGGTGNIVFRLNTLKLANAVDITAAGTTTDSTVTPPNGAGLQTAVTLGTFTPAAGGELWRINVLRQGADAADTASASTDLIGVEFQYTAAN